MNDLLKAIRLDHRIMQRRYPILLVLLALGEALGAGRGSTVTTIAVVILITAPVGGSYYFAVVEANRLDHLNGTLPLKRIVIEAGIYAYTVILVIVNGLLAAGIAWLIALAKHRTVSGTDVQMALAVAFLFACLYIGVIYPLYMAVPFSKVYALSNVPFYLAAVIVVYFGKRTEWLDSTLKLYHHHIGIASGITVVIAFALLTVSCAIAHITARRTPRAEHAPSHTVPRLLSFRS